MITLGAAVSAVGASYAAEPVLPDGWAVLDRLDDGPVQATLATVGGSRVLLATGTNQIEDWGARPTFNLDIRQRVVGRFTVHEGAWRYGRRLGAWAEVDGADLIVGHSLGAAASLLLGWQVGAAVLAVAPFAPFLGTAPPLPALSLIDPRDVVPYAPGPGWHRPGATLTLPPSRGTVPGAHGCASYARQLAGLAALDLTPWLEEPAR